MPAKATDVIKVAVALARRCAGYQYVKYKIMPGKKPASPAPNIKRTT